MGQVRDIREPDSFLMQKSIIDDYGPQIGAYGIAIYTFLARWANHESHTLRSIRAIARAVNLAPNTVIKYLNLLQQHGLIECQQRQDVAGDRDTTEYVLLQPQKISPKKGVSTSDTGVSIRASREQKKVYQPVIQVYQMTEGGVSTDATPVAASDAGVSRDATPFAISPSPLDSPSPERQRQEQTQDLPPIVPPVGDEDGQQGKSVERSKAKGKPKKPTYTPPTLTPEEQHVLDHLCTATQRRYRTLNEIGFCLDRGATVEECCLVIDWWANVKIRYDPKQDRYFDNETPFREKHFDKYRAAAEAWEKLGRPAYGQRNSVRQDLEQWKRDTIQALKEEDAHDRG